MTRHWAKWASKPSPAGLWLVAVFAAEQPEGTTEVTLRLDDGTVVNTSVDASHPVRIRNGVWACPTAERMTVKTVPACPTCGQPSRLPMSSGGARHVCAKTAGGPKASAPEEVAGETLF